MLIICFGVLISVHLEKFTEKYVARKPGAREITSHVEPTLAST